MSHEKCISRLRHSQSRRYFLEKIQELSDFTWYERTAREQVTGRIRGAEAVFIDAVAMDRKTMEDCPELKFIGIAATGFNHVDLDAARELGIAVANVPSYAETLWLNMP